MKIVALNVRPLLIKRVAGHFFQTQWVSLFSSQLATMLSCGPRKKKSREIYLERRLWRDGKRGDVCTLFDGQQEWDKKRMKRKERQREREKEREREGERDHPAVARNSFYRSFLICLSFSLGKRDNQDCSHTTFVEEEARPQEMKYNFNPYQMITGFL